MIYSKPNIGNEPIIDKCLGCDSVVVGPEPGPATCRRFLVPTAKWRIGNCPMASNIKKVAIEDKRVNPLKASKRKSKVLALFVGKK